MIEWRRHAIGWLAMVVAALVIGCGDDDDEDFDAALPEDAAPPDAARDAPRDAGDVAQLQFVHAAPDAPAIDVFVADADAEEGALVEDLEFGEVQRIPVPPGDVAFDIRPAAAEPTDDPIFTTDPITAQAGQRQILVAQGLLEETGENAFTVRSFVDEFEPAEEGTARVALLHAIVDADAVDVDIGGDATGPEDSEIQNLQRFDTAGTEGDDLTGISVPADMPLRVTLRTADGEPLTSFTVELPEGATALLIATGLLNQPARSPTSARLLAVGPPDSPLGEGIVVEQNPMLFALHAAPDAPAVDLFVEDMEVADDLAFGSLSSPIAFPPGAAELEVFVHEEGEMRPAGEPVATIDAGELPAGQRFLGVIAGFLTPQEDEAELQLIRVREAFALEDAQEDEPQDGRIRGVHAAGDAPAVLVGTATDTQIAMELFTLDFGEASDPEGEQLDPDTYTLGVAESGSTATIAQYPGIDIEAGDRVFAVLGGELTPRLTEQPLPLFRIDTTEMPWELTQVAPEQ